MTLKELRYSQGLSLAEMGEILGKSRSSMNVYETGKIKIPEEVYARIEEHFHVNLREEADKKPKAKAQPKPQAAPKEKQIEPMDGETLKEIRLAHNMTQKQLADLIGKSNTTVTGYEKGAVKVPAAVAETLRKWVAAQKKEPVLDTEPVEEEEEEPEEYQEILDLAAEEDLVPVIVQSMMGGSIRVEDVVRKVMEVAPRADAIYIKPEENRAYWTAGKKAGHVILW